MLFFIAVRSFGIIGAGAVLFAASGIAGLQTLGVVGELQHEVILEIDSETFSGVGTAATLAVGGGAVTRASCSPPFCVARTGQCCILTPGRRGRLVCPRSC